MLALPNKTWQQASTHESGEATLDLYTTHLPMTVYAAAPGYAAGVHREWQPDNGAYWSNSAVCRLGARPFVRKTLDVPLACATA